MHRSFRNEDVPLVPSNDPTPPPFGAFAPTPAQAAVIAIAHGSGLKRGVFRPWFSRLIDLIRSGPIDTHYQGAAFRFHHLASATERGALFNPDYNIEELNFLRAHTPAGGVFVDVGANVGTYAMVLAQHVGTAGKVIAVEPHPVPFGRLSFNRAASAFTQVRLVAAAASASDGELMMETDSDNIGASHVVTGNAGSHAFKVAALRLQRILEEAGVDHVDSLKIDVEGFEDRILTTFFAQAPESLWPRAVVIEHLSHDEWQDDCIADMQSRGYSQTGKTRSNTLLARS
jgi:FkbM family methyltransferase